MFQLISIFNSFCIFANFFLPYHIVIVLSRVDGTVISVLQCRQDAKWYNTWRVIIIMFHKHGIMGLNYII